MKQSFDLEKALRILKTRKITKDAVAKTTGVSPGYISKMLSGDKPLSQSFIDVFLKEYGSELEGSELIEISNKKVLIAQLALQAKVEVLTKLSLALIKALEESNNSQSGNRVRDYLKMDTTLLLGEFDVFVEDEVERLLKSQQSL
jgi:transcriptional regulator with XRE-family HTH domain